MAVEGIKTKIGYRLTDWIGQTVIEPLPHPHQSTWTINGYQPGAQGSSAIGNFTIPLFPPRSNEYHLYKGIYDKIQYGLRIEGYVLGESGEYMIGIPVFSGIITQIDFELDKFELKGFDSLWIAQQNVFYPGPPVNVAPQTIFLVFQKIDNLVFFDDFISGHQLLFPSSYSTLVGPAWTLTTDEGLNGYLQGATNTDCIIETNQPAVALAINTLSSYQTTEISAWYHIINPTLTNGLVYGAELVFLSDGTNNNLFLAQAELHPNGTTYDVHVSIFQKASGTYTLLKDTTAFTGLTGDFRCLLTVILTASQSFPTFLIVTVLVNGKDSGCTFTTSIQIGNALGDFLGFRWASSAGTSASVFVSMLYVKTKSSAYLPPTVSGYAIPTPFILLQLENHATTAQMLLAMNGLTLLDIWAIGAASSGWVFRLCRRRYYSLPFSTLPASTLPYGIDFLNVGPQGAQLNYNVPGPNSELGGCGIDLSGTVILDESFNVIAGGSVPNGESLGTELKLGFSQTTAGAGQITWPDFGGLSKLARIPGSAPSPPMIFSDLVNLAGVGDFLPARNIAQNVGAKKSLAGQAKTFTILRTPDIATPRIDVFSNRAVYSGDPHGGDFISCSLQAFNEQDSVMLNVPSLNINMVKATVLAYTFRENDPTMDVTLDQHPSTNKIILDRRRWGAMDSYLLQHT